MEKAKKAAKRVLVLSVILMFLSMIVVSCVQTAGGIRIKQLTIETGDGWMMDMDLFIPANATADTPAPAIVTSHGHYNNKEMQDANFVELARRGFVVLNIDQASHGDSDNLPGEATSDCFKGTYWGAKFLAELPYVDAEKIGVTGHSAGASTAINTNALKYEQEYGSKPLGELVREIVGLDMNAAKAAFSEYLEGANLDSRQIYFVNQIVEYIVHNGMMKDLSVLQESPFTDQGSVVEIFTDLNVWMGIRKVIESINDNAIAA